MTVGITDHDWVGTVTKRGAPYRECRKCGGFDFFVEDGLNCCGTLGWTWHGHVVTDREGVRHFATDHGRST